MKFKLTCENENPKDFEIAVNFEAEHIGDVVQNIVLFLRGVGFGDSTIEQYINTEYF
jgi:hypothetical protein